MITTFLNLHAYYFNKKIYFLFKSKRRCIKNNDKEVNKSEAVRSPNEMKWTFSLDDLSCGAHISWSCLAFERHVL